MAPKRRWALVGVAALVVLALDQLTKWWAVTALCGPPFCSDRPENLGRTVDLVWTLRFNYAENTGMAFSKGAGQGRVIGLVVVVIVGVLLVVARRLRSPVQLVLVGVVVGGAVGNLVDRLFRASEGFLSGGVVDFVDLQWWPIFNVADAAVVLGGFALAFTGLREEPEDRADREDAEAEAEADARAGGAPSERAADPADPAGPEPAAEPADAAADGEPGPG